MGERKRNVAKARASKQEGIEEGEASRFQAQAIAPIESPEEVSVNR